MVHCASYEIICALYSFDYIFIKFNYVFLLFLQDNLDNHLMKITVQRTSWRTPLFEVSLWLSFCGRHWTVAKVYCLIVIYIHGKPKPLFWYYHWSSVSLICTVHGFYCLKLFCIKHIINILEPPYEMNYFFTMHFNRAWRAMFLGQHTKWFTSFIIGELCGFKLRTD